MQTARRAAASIANPGDQGVPLFCFLKNFGIRGSTVIGLGSAHDISYAEFLDEIPL